MNILPGALLAGGVMGLGVAVAARSLVAQPLDLREAMARLDSRNISRGVVSHEQPGVKRKLAVWVQRTVGGSVLAPVPMRDLALLRQTPEEYFERKAFAALGGFFLGAFLAALVTPLLLLFGVSFALPVPLAVVVLLTAVMWFIPDVETRQKGEEARQQVRRALCAYFDLVALERRGGEGAVSALTNAAAVGDSWVFMRIREELVRAEISGVRPWDSLRQLGEQIGITELEGLGDVMQNTGDSGAEAYAQLRSRAKSQRSALLSQHQGNAAAGTQKMTVPSTALSLIFSLLLLFPAMAHLL